MIGALGFISITAFVLSVILARVLTVEEMGHLYVIRTVIDFLQLPAAFGMVACIAKHVADSRTSDDQRAAIFATGIYIATIAAAAVALLVSALTFVPNILRDLVALRTLRWMIFVLPAVAFFNCTMGYLQGTGQIRRMSLAYISRSVIVLLLGSVLAVRFGFGGWAVSRVLAEFLAGLLMIALIVAPLKGFKLDAARVKPFLRFGRYVALSTLMSTSITAIDIICLDRFRADPAEIGQYGIAVLVMTTSLMVPGAYVQAVYSKIIAHAHDPQRTWNNYLRHTALLLAIVVPVGLIGYVLAPAIGWAFGVDYEPSEGYYRLLIPSFVFFAAGHVGRNLVIGAGLTKLLAATLIAAVAANVILNVILIPSLGVHGAIIARNSTHALEAICFLFILWRYKRRGGSHPQP